jgi:hypothetical protein
MSSRNVSSYRRTKQLSQVAYIMHTVTLAAAFTSPNQKQTLIYSLAHDVNIRRPKSVLCSRLDYRRGDETEETDQIQTSLMQSVDIDVSTNSKQITKAAVKNAKEAVPKQNVTTDPANSSTDSIRSERSKQRMLKAQKLLEMAQVSPSQRLEMEQFRNGGNSTSSIATTSFTVRTGGQSRGKGVKHSYNTTSDVALRMADTFDSVDNLVDSKSLLPGGRWVEDDTVNQGDNGESEMELRKTRSAGQVAEV